MGQLEHNAFSDGDNGGGEGAEYEDVAGIPNHNIMKGNDDIINLPDDFMEGNEGNDEGNYDDDEGNNIDEEPKFEKNGMPSFGKVKKNRKNRIIDDKEELTEEEKIMKRIDFFANQVGNINFNSSKKANGVFTYKVNKNNQKRQNYTMIIRNMYDVVYCCALLRNREGIKILPDHYKKIYEAFEVAFPNNDSILLNFCYREISPWINTKTRKVVYSKKIFHEEIKNPITGKWIKKSIKAKNYRELFGKIKLKKVIYAPLENYNSIDYDVFLFCVPSFLESKLTKKEYKVIKDDLSKNPTPTYIELTIMLNKINYNLIVYVTDEECIQMQTEYDKKLTIMIHDEHMYVLKNTDIHRKNVKTIKCTQDEYDKIQSEVYTNSFKISKGIKYKLDNRFKVIEQDLCLKNSFSQSNIDFFNSCGIRAVRYIKNNLELIEGFDVDKCYFNILQNPNYVFGVQNGTEITEKYDIDNDYIHDHGFYYCIFKNPTEADDVLCGENPWIQGYLINKLKLKVDIKYKHVPSRCEYGSEKLTHSYIDVIHYTGDLAKYETCKTNMYECDGLEAESFLLKYPDSSRTDGYVTIKKFKDGKETEKEITYLNEDEKNKIINEHKDNYLYYTKPYVTITREYFKKNSGMYAYLSIMQYARLQLYYIYKEVKKVNPEVRITKAYTDAIYFNENISIDLNKLNKNLSQFGFSVKSHKSNYTWGQRDIQRTKEPIVINKETTYYDSSKVIELLSKGMSFCINAPPGYGKTRMLEKEIIPFFEKNNLKYMLTTTTKKLSEKLNCQCIHSILLSNESYLKSLIKKFENIDYLIIDECSLLSVNLINVIQYLKKNTKVNIILSGDINQCSYELTISNIMDTYLFKSIINHNILTIKWHKNARYGQDYDIFLNGLLKFKSGKDTKCINYIKNYFKNQIFKGTKKSKDEIILTYTNDFGKLFGKDEQNKFIYSTVHKAQGETIDKPYSIYEIQKMDIRIIYTALSRCTDPKLISIYLL